MEEQFSNTGLRCIDKARQFIQTFGDDSKLGRINTAHEHEMTQTRQQQNVKILG